MKKVWKRKFWKKFEEKFFASKTKKVRKYFYKKLLHSKIKIKRKKHRYPRSSLPPAAASAQGGPSPPQGARLGEPLAARGAHREVRRCSGSTLPRRRRSRPAPAALLRLGECAATLHISIACCALWERKEIEKQREEAGGKKREEVVEVVKFQWTPPCASVGLTVSYLPSGQR